MKQKAFPAPIVNRVKAFIVDLFIISIPLLYITTYVILDGKDDFQHNQTAIFGVWAVFGLIQTAFFARGAQSPGYRSQNLYVVGADGKKADFFTYLLRYILFVAGFIFGGSFLCFFRPDKRNLHDVLTKTYPVAKNA